MRSFILSQPFDFITLVNSHGWRFLAPNQWDDSRAELSRPLTLRNGTSMKVTMRYGRGEKHGVEFWCDGNRPIGIRDKKEITAQISRMFCLAEDFTSFHQMCHHDSVLRFVTIRRCGGMLRSPTAFEDVLKTVCTINCDWRNTKSMCSAFCALADGTFPRPEHLLRFSEAKLQKLVPVGYRSRTVMEVAKAFAEDRLPLDQWASSGQWSHIRAQLADVWGLGKYAISHILVLLGDYAEIPVDSEVLRYLQATHFGGRDVRPKEAIEPYSKYGQYSYLAYKFSRIGRRNNYIDNGT